MNARNQGGPRTSIAVGQSVQFMDDQQDAPQYVSASSYTSSLVLQFPRQEP